MCAGAIYWAGIGGRVRPGRKEPQGDDRRPAVGDRPAVGKDERRPWKRVSGGEQRESGTVRVEADAAVFARYSRKDRPALDAPGR
jgi:hypothetical protein